MESARADTPGPSRQPTLTTVIIADHVASSTAGRVAALTDGITNPDDIEVVLLLTGPEDEDAGASHASPVAARIPGADHVVRAVDADPATITRCGAAAARGTVITFLAIDDDVSHGYLAALMTSALPDTIGVAAAPGWTPEWSQARPIAHGVVESTDLTGKVFPVAVLRDVTLPTGLDITSAGAVLLARIAGTYRYQHLMLSASPARAGATHRGEDTGTETAVAGLIGLHRGGDRTDTKVAAALTRVWMEQLRDGVHSGSADATALHRRLTRCGVDIRLEDLRKGPPSPVLTEFFSDQPFGAYSIAVVVSDVAVPAHVSAALRGLSRCGSTVVVIHSSGKARPSLSSHVTVIDTRVDTEGAAARLIKADDIIAIDAAALATTQQLVPERTLQRGIEPLLGHYLDRAARSPAGGGSGEDINTAARRLAEHKQPLRIDQWTWPVLALRVLRVRSGPTPDDLIATGRQVIDADSAARAALDAVAALVHAETVGTDGLRAAADGVIARADAAATEELVAHFLHYLGMELLFEPSQHTSVPSTPLVESPDLYLAGLHRSRLHQLITSSGTPTHLSRRGGPTGRAVLLTGAFPKFFGVLVEALRLDHMVDRIDLSTGESRFRNVMMDPTTFRLLLNAAEGRESHLLDRSQTSLLVSADVVVADWADKGLALASRIVPDGTRLFARVHGSDTLSPWAHLIRWDRVDGVIAPSAHLARALRAVVGPAMEHVPVHVVPNPVDTSRLAPDKTADARRTLGLVGWAQRVKDPIFALDVLAQLRAEDPNWRLRLVGADFSNRARQVEKDAGQAFRVRSARSDVAGAIDYVPFTNDISTVMPDIGWSLSTSLRESFHLGLFEMAASGAVPVVRDWPVYASIGGAGSFVPPTWVVPTPDAAAARILEVDADWETERLAARDHVVSRYDHNLVVGQLRDLLCPANSL